MRRMRYLGIDYGTRKVGLALSDEAGTMGFPHSIAANDGRLMETVRALAAAQSVGGFVIGESRNFAGEENPVAAEARAFGARLLEETGIPVFFEAEMLTTQEARRAIDGAHPNDLGTAARKTAAPSEGKVDAAAAALILTSYLSKHHD